jgi:CRP/FNR family transcriptional regulator
MSTTSTAETTALLAKVPLFSALSEAELQAVASHAFRKTFSPGEYLFLEGEPCQGMFLVTSGAVRIFKASASGREILLTMETAPASIAEIPVFDGGNYPASAAAVDEVTAHLILKADFQRLCRENPDLALKVLTVVGKRLRVLVTMLHQVTFGGIRQRLAQTLLDFEQENGGSPFTLPETHHELALRLGSVREVISRNLGRFQAQQFIRSQGREITILDHHGLQHEAETEMH